MTDELARTDKVTVETVIAADPAAVWRALTDDIDAWWPEAFYTGGDAATRRYVVEARPGGRMYEDWGDDQGLLWAVVNTVQKPSLLQIWGVAFPGWGGPSLLTGTWSLEADGSGTRLRFTEATVGKLSESHMRSKEKGWTFLFDGALKAHLEGRPVPTWED